MDATTLVTKLCPPLDTVLVKSLIQEFIDVERRYVLGDWEPATLNGGQLAEIAARIVYHVDANNLNRRKGVDECLTYVEDENNANTHAFPHRRSALHLCRALRLLYKLRSQRGAIHIDPDYSANELDSTLVIGLCRWIVSEVLRIFWSGSTADVARAIREIVRFQVPAVLLLDGKPLVLRTDCTVEEEMLILLHNAGETGLTRTELGAAIPKDGSTVTRALQKLSSPAHRAVIKKGGTRYVLTPNGSLRVQKELSHKLSVE